MTLSNMPYDGNITNIPQGNIEQYENTASRQTQKLQLGIMPGDTILPFSDIDKQATWKYQSEAGYPSLTRLAIVRQTGLDQATNEQWKALYDALLNTLPEDVKDALAEMNRLPLEKRNPRFFPNYDMFLSFEIALQYAAKSSFWVLDALRKSEGESAMNNTQLNASLPDIVLNNMVQETNEFVTLAENALNGLTENHPDFYALSQALNQLQANAKNISGATQ